MDTLKSLLIALSLASLLAGCVKANGQPSNFCPKLIPHTQAFWNGLADDIDEIVKTYPRVQVLVDDTGLYIKQIKRCIAAQKAS